MNEAFVDYPPPPWRSRGQFWMGLFRAAEPPAVPDGMAPILSSRLVVLVLRYQEGTLVYDELLVGSMARLGRRVGVTLHGIWVDDLASLWGGRRIWGVPKQLAEFTWTKDEVEITDSGGPIVRMTLQRRSQYLPSIWFPLTGFGMLEDQTTFLTGMARSRLAAASVHVNQWSDRLPTLSRGDAGPTGMTALFRMTVPAPKLLTRKSVQAERAL